MARLRNGFDRTRRGHENHAVDAALELAVLMALRVRGRGDAASVALARSRFEADAGAALARRGPPARRAGAKAPSGSPRPDARCSRAPSPPSLSTAMRSPRSTSAFSSPTASSRRRSPRGSSPADARQAAARAGVMASAATAGGIAAALAASRRRARTVSAPHRRRPRERSRPAIARFVASPRVDSLHQAWFELHEDLLVTLGRSRAT